MPKCSVKLGWRDTALVASEIKKLEALSRDELRLLWRKAFNNDVTKSLTRDLLLRMLAWKIQEQAFGGHDKDTLKILGNCKDDRSPATASKMRRMQPGTEFVREYRGIRHTVTVTMDGFIWEGRVYRSLSVIARTITGCSWSGPRFFGFARDPNAFKGPRVSSGLSYAQNIATTAQ